jgi:hypothetical protein
MKTMGRDTGPLTRAFGPPTWIKYPNMNPGSECLKSSPNPSWPVGAVSSKMDVQDASGLRIQSTSRRWKANSETHALTKFQPIWPKDGCRRAGADTKWARSSRADSCHVTYASCVVCCLIQCTWTLHSGRFGEINEGNLAKRPLLSTYK